MSTKSKSKNASKPQTTQAVGETVGRSESDSPAESQLDSTQPHPAVEQTQKAEQAPAGKPKKEREPDPIREQMQALAADADIALRAYKEHAEVVKLARQRAQEALDVYRGIQSKRKELRVEMEKRVLERLSKKYGGAQ